MLRLISNFKQSLLPVCRLLSILCFTLLSTLPRAEAETARPLVVSSFTIIGDWVQVIAGKQVELVNLVPSRSETHGYQLSARNARDLRRARLIVGMNPSLEPWLETWAKANERTDRLIWLYDDPKPAAQPAAHDTDPHAWTNPAEAKKMLRVLADHLSHLDPQHPTETFYNQYVKGIDQVDDELRQLFATLPPERRNMVTQHANLGHFAASYGLRISRTILASGSAESADPSAHHYSDLLALIRHDKIRVIVADAGQSDALARRLAADAGLPAPLSISFEYLEPAGHPCDSWKGMMLHNGRRLHEALAR